jgi:UDP-glucose 4-epimerase
MNILITGGAGYIGSIVCELLERQLNNIIVVDDLRDGNKSALSKDITFYEANFGDSQVLHEIFSKHNIDLVCHLAASANVPDSVINPIDYYENNVSNTLSLLKVMASYQVKRIIFSSTAAVYGEPQYTPIDEAHILKPVNPYGYSKLVVENILKDYAKAYELQYIVFRYFCAAGATDLHGESRKYESHLIPLVVDNILNLKDKLTVFGIDFNTEDGSGVRDYIHVKDIARAHVLAIQKIDVLKNEIFNLGNNIGSSVFDVIKTTERLYKCKVNYINGERRLGDPEVLVAAYDKAKKLLGWTPQNKLDKIIETAYNWRKSPKY